MSDILDDYDDFDIEYLDVSNLDCSDQDLVVEVAYCRFNGIEYYNKCALEGGNDLMMANNNIIKDQQRRRCDTDSESNKSNSKSKSFRVVNDESEDENDPGRTKLDFDNDDEDNDLNLKGTNESDKKHSDSEDSSDSDDNQNSTSEESNDFIVKKKKKKNMVRSMKNLNHNGKKGQQGSGSLFNYNLDKPETLFKYGQFHSIKSTLFTDISSNVNQGPGHTQSQIDNDELIKIAQQAKEKGKIEAQRKRKLGVLELGEGVKDEYQVKPRVVGNRGNGMTVTTQQGSDSQSKMGAMNVGLHSVQEENSEDLDLNDQQLSNSSSPDCNTSKLVEDARSSGNTVLNDLAADLDVLDSDKSVEEESEKLQQVVDSSKMSITQQKDETVNTFAVGITSSLNRLKRQDTQISSKSNLRNISRVASPEPQGITGISLMKGTPLSGSRLRLNDKAGSPSPVRAIRGPSPGPGSAKTFKKTPCHSPEPRGAIQNQIQIQNSTQKANSSSIITPLISKYSSSKFNNNNTITTLSKSQQLLQLSTVGKVHGKTPLSRSQSQLGIKMDINPLSGQKSVLKRTLKRATSCTPLPTPKDIKGGDSQNKNQNISLKKQLVRSETVDSKTGTDNDIMIDLTRNNLNQNKDYDKKIAYSQSLLFEKDPDDLQNSISVETDSLRVKHQLKLNWLFRQAKFDISAPENRVAYQKGYCNTKSIGDNQNLNQSQQQLKTDRSFLKMGSLRKLEQIDVDRDNWAIHIRWGEGYFQHFTDDKKILKDLEMKNVQMNLKNENVALDLTLERARQEIIIFDEDEQNDSTSADVNQETETVQDDHDLIFHSQPNSQQVVTFKTNSRVVTPATVGAAANNNDNLNIQNIESDHNNMLQVYNTALTGSKSGGLLNSIKEGSSSSSSTSALSGTVATTAASDSISSTNQNLMNSLSKFGSATESALSDMILTTHNDDQNLPKPATLDLNESNEDVDAIKDNPEKSESQELDDPFFSCDTIMFLTESDFRIFVESLYTKKHPLKDSTSKYFLDPEAHKRRLQKRSEREADIDLARIIRENDPNYSREKRKAPTRILVKGHSRKGHRVTPHFRVVKCNEDYKKKGWTGLFG